MKRRLCKLQWIMTTLFLWSGLCSLQAQTSSDEAIRQALAGWEFLSEVDLGVTRETTEGQKKKVTGSAAAFGQTTSLEATFSAGQKLERIAFIFPEMVQLNTKYVRMLAGKDLPQILPPGLDANIGYERIEVDFAGRQVTAARVIMHAGTWTPFNGQELKINSLKLSLGVINPLSSPKALELGMVGRVMLPEELASQLDLGATALTLTGSVNTATGDLSMSIDLSSREIPLHPDKIVVLRQAKMEFYVQDKAPGLALGGQLEIRPPSQPDSILLNGEIAIDLTGEIFAQGWLEGYWHNPLGLSDDLYITALGGGFGLDFKALPIPIPIMAFEGGFNVGSANPEEATFAGSLTVGFHGSDPTKNMIDGRIKIATLYDIAEAFYPQGVPADLAKVFKQIHLRDARLTIVPPGDGIELFGKQYEPGFHIQGHYDVGEFTGSMLISISEDGFQAYSGMSPLHFDGMSITASSDPRKGPESYIELKKSGGINPLAGGFFAIDSKISVPALGLKSDTDIYLSDAGFSATLSSRITGDFEADLDIAGKDLFQPNGGIFLEANLRNDLFDRIDQVAADHIDQLTRNTQQKFDQAQADIDRNRPRLEQYYKNYQSARNVVKAEYDTRCTQAHNAETQAAAQRATIKRIDDQIRKLRTEKQDLDRKVAGGYTSARFNQSTSITSCPSGSTYDAIDGGGCWTCPPGYTRDHLIAINNPKACVRPAYKDFKPAINLGPAQKNFLGMAVICSQGFADLGRCWKIPAGYQRENLIAINQPNATSRLIPEDRKMGDKVADRSCRNGFVDPRNGGECWSCPSGFIRPTITVHPVNGSKACEKPQLAQWLDRSTWVDAEILKLQAEKAAAERILNPLLRDLNGALRDACKKANDLLAVDLDSRVAPKKKLYDDLKTQMDIWQTILDGSRFISVNSLRAGEWIARNGGQALGVVKIRKAYFSGCVSSFKGSKVALHVEGTFADQPLNTSFNFDLAGPEQTIRVFSEYLLQNKTPPADWNTSNCTRPVVPRPDISGSTLAEFKREAKNNPNIAGQEPPRTEARPEWAGTSRFAAGTVTTSSGSAVAVSNNPGTTTAASPSAREIDKMFHDGMQAYQEGRLVAAFQLLEKAGNYQHREAQFSCGVLSWNGQGTPQDFSQALAWYLKAAEQEHPTAQKYAGDLYLNGYGTAPDRSKALYWYRRAAGNGMQDAIDKLRELGE